MSFDISLGRVKLEDEAIDFRVSMPETERLNESIDLVDLSFVTRERTPRWTIEVGIRCHLAGMSLREVSKYPGELGIDRSHVAIHDWVHKADLQPAATISANQLTVDEKMIRLHGEQFWLYGAVDPHTNKIMALSLFPTTTNVTTRWFLDELHWQYWLRDITFLVDGADYLTEVLADGGYDYRYEPHSHRNAIKRIFREIEQRA